MNTTVPRFHMPFTHPTTRSSARSGVTILEVLIAIGVVSIGLLGVAALIPLAIHQTLQGVIYDTGSRVGRDAFREFDLRRMTDPYTWVAVDPGPSVVWPVPLVDADGVRRSFAIDPRFVAQHGATGAGASDPTRFPYQDPATVLHWMPRITVASAPLTLQTPPQPMGQFQADRTFVSEDDLQLRKPSDRSLPPYQLSNEADEANNPLPWDPTNPQGGPRNANGDFSWMATVVPKPNSSSDLYVLSIVVFHRRDGSMAMDALNEQALQATDFYSGGFGGGDIAVTPAGGVTIAADEWEVRRGDWVMLSRNIDTNSPPDTLAPYFRWYRVIAADSEIDTSSGTPKRHITLHGADWQPDPNHPTQVLLVQDVVAVFEKTIRLENSSLWQ